MKQTTLIIHPPTLKQLDAAESWSPVGLISRMYFIIEINEMNNEHERLFAMREIGTEGGRILQKGQ